jgi:hypothetical protein
VSIPEIPLNSSAKFFRVRFPRFGKIHIAREPKDGVYKTLCGYKLSCSSTFGVSTTVYHGDECGLGIPAKPNAKIRDESERHSGMIPNTIGA